MASLICLSTSISIASAGFKRIITAEYYFNPIIARWPRNEGLQLTQHSFKCSPPVIGMFPFPEKKIPTGKLRKQWKITILNGKHIFKGSIFHCYVSLPECTSHDWQLHPSELVSRTHEQHQFQTTCFGKKKLLHTISPKQICNFTAKQPLDLQNIPKTSPICSFNTNCPLFHPSWDSQTLGTSGVLFTSAVSSSHGPALVRIHSMKPLVWWFQHVSSI